MCPEGSLYGTAACLVSGAITLIVDAAVFSTPAALADLLPDHAADVPNAVKEAMHAAADVMSRKPWKWLGGVLPSWMGSSYAEAAESWRESFLREHPQHEANFKDSASLLSTAMVVFVLLLCTVLCTRWLLSWVFGGGSRGASELLFFPDRSGRHAARLCKELGGARQRLWVSVCGLTDDLISTEVLRAHARGVDVRVLVAGGADVQRLEQAGVPVARTDSTSPHGPMGHRFVLVDDVVFAGSFSWTRQACESSREHLCRSCDRASVRAFRGEFEGLWRELSSGRGRNLLKSRQRRAATPPPPLARGGA